MATRVRWTALCGAACCCAAAAGCGQETVAGDVTVYAYDWWLGTLLLLLAPMALGAGVQLRRESKPWFALGVMAAGPLAALAFAPGAFLNHVTVAPEYFEVRYGFWWAPEYHHARFDEVTDVRIVTYAVQGGRGKSYYSDLHYTLKSGVHRTIPLNGDLRREGGPDILAMARARGAAAAP